MKRLLIYSDDTFGLGDLRRMASIATYLTQHNPALNKLLLSESSGQAARNYVRFITKQQEVS